jgi:hypothetical protein
MFRAAQSLLDAVLTSPLVPSDSGVLVESRDPSGTCDQDQRMFKGVFFEHLAYFLRDMVVLPELPTSTKITLLRKYSGFVYANAAAVWNDAGGRDGMISSWWAIPGGGIGTRQTSVETLGSGISAVSCAVLVDTLLGSLEGVGDSDTCA